MNFWSFEFRQHHWSAVIKKTGWVWPEDRHGNTFLLIRESRNDSKYFAGELNILVHRISPIFVYWLKVCMHTLFEFDANYFQGIWVCQCKNWRRTLLHALDLDVLSLGNDEWRNEILLRTGRGAHNNRWEDQSSLWNSCKLKRVDVRARGSDDLIGAHSLNELGISVNWMASLAHIHIPTEIWLINCCEAWV